ncbi:MAG TPA: nuclear transport factor 2 family protein [Actinocrinis sp.]|nr:nuclear transport factor 2 family protein [Actinocrinis sp.]
MAVEVFPEVEIQKFVEDWYVALDVHDPIEQVEPYLTPQGLVMTFPEGTLHGLSGFREWYKTVTHRFFDEEHAVTSVQADWRPDGTVGAKVVVNWQARIWDAPAARSVWLGFDAYQTWVLGRNGDKPVILSYVVDELKPMPGSASL